MTRLHPTVTPASLSTAKTKACDLTVCYHRTRSQTGIFILKFCMGRCVLRNTLGNMLEGGSDSHSTAGSCHQPGESYTQQTASGWCPGIGCNASKILIHQGESQKLLTETFWRKCSQQQCRSGDIWDFIDSQTNPGAYLFPITLPQLYNLLCPLTRSSNLHRTSKPAC